MVPCIHNSPWFPDDYKRTITCITYRERYKSRQSQFDRMYRREKRKFERNRLLQIKALETNDPRKFWDAIKKSGPRGDIGEIPNEVILEDGSESDDPFVVMNEWQKAIFKDPGPRRV